VFARLAESTETSEGGPFIPVSGVTKNLEQVD